MNILLDTKILTRWVNPKDPGHPKVRIALRKLRAGGHSPTLVPQCLYELWAVATRPVEVNGMGLSVEDALTKLQIAKRMFQVLRDERAILPRWLELVETYQVTGKPSHDARLVAAMLRHGLTHLLTFNTQDFRRYEEIVAIHPDQLIADASTLPEP